MAALASNPGMIPVAVEELLRHSSPVQWIVRMAKQDLEFEGHQIAGGHAVFLGLGAANRDPRVFDHPERFVCSRDPNPHLAFGHGIHYCIGAALARLQATIAIRVLLERASRLVLVDVGEWLPNLTLSRAPATLHVRLQGSIS